MQPKFTQRSLGYFCTKIIALALILTATTQFSFAQQKPGAVKKPAEKMLEQKKAELDIIKANSVHSVGAAPVQSRGGDIDPVPNAGSPFSSAFCYQTFAPGFRLNKQSLLNTTLTPIGASVPFGFPGAAAWVTTTQKMYVVDQAAPFALYIVDTLTGVRTFVANCTGVPQANLTGMTWDPSNNTMYGVSTSLAVSQIFTINITTGVCTPIGPASGVCAGAIQLNAAPLGGSLFSVDIVLDNLYKWNKTTGVPTLVGPLGVNANFGQDGHFDISDGQYFWAAFTTGPQLRIIDTLTGGSTLVGAYTAQVETFAIYPIPQAPCAGTPNPGNTLSTANPVCPTEVFTLTPQNLTIGSGVTYLWESSPNGTTWTTIPGTGGSLSRTQTTATYYRVTVTCAGNSTTSTPVQVTMKTILSCYCNSGATSTADEDVFNVTFGTINNSSNCASTGPGPGSIKNRYSNYTTLPVGNAVTGNNQPISIQIGTCGGNFGSATGVWIDYNQNGAFENPAERAFLSGVANGPHTATGLVNIPTTAVSGVTLMRVVNVETGNPAGILPCGTYTWGETEDYLINIQPCVPLTGITIPATTNAECSGSANITANTGLASLPTFTWEYKATAASLTWLPLPNGTLGGATVSGATTGTLVLSNIPSTLTGYVFRAVVQNPCSGIDFSNSTTLVVGPLVARLNVTSPVTICNGTIQALTLTNASSPATTTFSSGAISVAIPDLNDCGGSTAAVTNAGINHTIPVVLPPGSAITRIDLRLNITHTYASDLLIVLKNSTTNQVLNLFYHKSGAQTAGANFTNTVISSVGTTRFSAVAPPFTNTFRADWELSPGSYGDITGAGPTAFQPTTQSWNTLWGGVNQGSGNWTIAICDPQEWAGDCGTLTSWSMDITYGAPAAGVWTQTSPASPNSMFSDPAATIAYIAGTLANTIYVKPLDIAPFTGTSATYCVVYSTPSPSCTSAPTCVTVNVTSPVAGLVIAPASNPVCLGSTATFTANTTSGGPLTYVWQVSVNGGLTYTNVPGGTSKTLTIPNVTQIMNNNLYRVTVTAAPCGSVTSVASAVLTILPLPVVSISAPDLALTPGQTTTITASVAPPLTGVSYSWTRNGSVIAGATGSTRVVGIDQLGTYRATVTASNGCTNTSNALVIGSEQSDRLWIYPNPTTGVFQVRLFFGDNMTENRFVSVYNSQGQVVATQEAVLTNVSEPYVQMNFDLSKQAAGTYVVKVAHKRTGKITSGLVVKQSQ